MTSASWATLVPAIAAFLFGAGAYLKSRSAHKRLDAITRDAKSFASFQQAVAKNNPAPSPSGTVTPPSDVKAS